MMLVLDKMRILGVQGRRGRSTRWDGCRGIKIMDRERVRAGGRLGREEEGKDG